MSISKVYDDDDGFSMLTYSYACVDPAFISLTYNLHSIEHSTARFFLNLKLFFVTHIRELIKISVERKTNFLCCMQQSKNHSKIIMCDMFGPFFYLL